jgi:hypothetical protein
MPVRLFVLLFLLLLSAAAAAAEDGYISGRKLAPAEFPQLVEALGREMDAGGRFEFVTDGERAGVESALAEIGRLLVGHDSIESLPDADRIAVLNAQERANAILARRDGERVICERRKVVGSNMRQLVCETYAEQQFRSRGSRDRARELNKRIQVCGDDGVCING